MLWTRSLCHFSGYEVSPPLWLLMMRGPVPMKFPMACPLIRRTRKLKASSKYRYLAKTTGERSQGGAETEILLRARTFSDSTISERHFLSAIFRFDVFRFIQFPIQTISDSDIFRPDIFLFFCMKIWLHFKTFSYSDIFPPDIFQFLG